MGKCYQTYLPETNFYFDYFGTGINCVPYKFWKSVKQKGIGKFFVNFCLRFSKQNSVFGKYYQTQLQK